MSNKLIKLPIYFIVIGVFFSNLNVTFTNIVDAKQSNKNTGLRISPLRSKPSQKPGETTYGSVSVTNVTKQAMMINVTVERFKTVDEYYNYDFAQDENTKWVRIVDNQVILEPNSSKTISYSLAVPNNASPGGYYFAIFASTENGSDESKFKEIKRVASLIYLEVSGDINRNINLIGVDVSWLTMKRSITLTSRLHNQGNSHYASRTKTEVTNLLGWPKYTSTKDALILPGTIRKIDSNILIPSFPGIYTVKTTFTPPQGGNNQQITKKLVYLPYWLLIVLFLLLLLAIYCRLKNSQKD